MSGTLRLPSSPRASPQPTGGRIEAITRAVGLFREDEIPVALEVFDAAVAGRPPATPTRRSAPISTASLVGWICWGPTPCTLGTYDLYWMAVDPEVQGTGIGTALLLEMERRLAGLARLIVIETAGRPDYAATRAFYQGRGYSAGLESSPTSMHRGTIRWCL